MLYIMLLCFDLSFASQTVSLCESLRDTYSEKTFLFVNAVVGLTWWGESEITLFVILSSLWKSPNSPSKHFDLQVRGDAAVKGKNIKIIGHHYHTYQAQTKPKLRFEGNLSK